MFGAAQSNVPEIVTTLLPYLLTILGTVFLAWIRWVTKSILETKRFESSTLQWTKNTDKENTAALARMTRHSERLDQISESIVGIKTLYADITRKLDQRFEAVDDALQNIHKSLSNRPKDQH